ncbi:MAG: YjbH domain-containing protein [Gammaproteobacteria bacterium]|nr:YjbH domain-containing protein [Gammaproteobacteria bacterium]
MPSARIPAEGTLRFGLSQRHPYTTFWSGLALFSRLELGARYTATSDVSDASNALGRDTSKDKVFDAKLLLWPETQYLPAVSIGSQDFLVARMFDPEYLVASKQIGEFDLSLGYGRSGIDGGFYGLAYEPSWVDGIRLIYEYDAHDYRNDFRASRTPGGSTYAINYQWGWLGFQASYQRGGHAGINANVSVPLMQKEFIPKQQEPPPPTTQNLSVPDDIWDDPTEGRIALAAAFRAQGYSNIQIIYDGKMLDIGFSHRRISLVGRAVGRAVRTALLLAPRDLNVIRVTYFTLSDQALVTYQFDDMQQLRLFFEGERTYMELLDGLTVRYANPAHSHLLSDAGLMADEKHTPPVHSIHWTPNEESKAIALSAKGKQENDFHLFPFNLGVFFNNTGGAARYEIFSLAKYKKRLAQGVFFESSARLLWLEDISRESADSNSTLPHVRTDIDAYKRDAQAKFNSLLVNRFLHFKPRFYGRFSVGYYEEMFGGTGGQILYFSKDRPWAVDLALDWLRQRDTGSGLGFQRYQTVTAIASLHYRIPQYGLTFTLRGGRFLAKDVGLRYEFQRRFRSGIRIGAWYTMTDGRDITSPGAPGSPYRDKGIFVSVPLSSMKTSDSRETPQFAISPWTRDVGQMVESPGDLYRIVEDPLMFDRDGGHLLLGFHH